MGLRNPSPKGIIKAIKNVKSVVVNIRDYKLNVAKRKFRRQNSFPHAYNFERY